MSQPLPPGSRVALLLSGSLEYVDLVLALMAAQVYPVPLDPALSCGERRRILAVVRPEVVVDSSEALAALEASGDPRGLPRVRPMHCTSGTTGTPKGVCSGLLSEPEARSLLAEEIAMWGLGPDDTHLVLSPLHHSAPLRFATHTLLAGGRVLAPEPFDPARVTERIRRDRPSTVFCVPAHLQRLFAYWDDHGVPDLSCFRLVAHAGAPCPPDLKRRLVELFPAGTTWEFYGSTEGQFTACRSEEWMEHPGTVGRARPGRELEVRGGMIWCRVPPYARFTYFGDPGKTAEAWRGDWFTVGDLGRLDDEGYLYLDGRREDLIITGGVNVYPAEVENVLREADDVTDVAVFGVDDPEWGQRVCAAVVGTRDVTALTQHAREHLSPPKRPKDYVFLDALPRTASGKIRRRDLAAPRGD